MQDKQSGRDVTQGHNNGNERREPTFGDLPLMGEQSAARAAQSTGSGHSVSQGDAASTSQHGYTSLGMELGNFSPLEDEQADIIHACLICTTPPDERQIKGIENFLCRKYSAQKAKITVQKDDSLIGGFILRVGSDEYDRSIKGRMDRLEQDLRAVQVRYS